MLFSEYTSDLLTIERKTLAVASAWAEAKSEDQNLSELDWTKMVEAINNAVGGGERDVVVLRRKALEALGRRPMTLPLNNHLSAQLETDGAEGLLGGA